MCHTLKIAPGTVARGSAGNDEAASDVARPEFCIPTSMDSVLLLFRSIPTMRPTTYPAAYPIRL